MDRSPSGSGRLHCWKLAPQCRLVTAVCLLLVGRICAVESTWNHAVELSATVPTEAPWSITLTWPEDSTATADYSPGYTVFRKSADGAQWSPGTPLPPGQTTFVDHDVKEGVRYEYCVFREFRRPNDPGSNHDGYGYIEAGINIPFVHERGKVILVVESRVAATLGDKVGRLQQDIAGDGWQVARLEVSADASPGEVRALIQQEHQKSPAEVVFLLGRIPIARSGSFAPDGHEPRAMPADGFYGDVDGKWIDADGDGIFDDNAIPSDIELQVGRVDFAEMEGARTEKTEVELIARYLDKNHAFRHSAVRPPRKGIIADRMGLDRGRAPAASAYRAFATFFGPENVVRANAEDGNDDSERLLPKISREPYLWAFGSGGGSVDGIAFMGTQGEYKIATSADFASGTKATFYLLFGSYFVDWARPNNLMRAALAAPTYGLAAAWTGRPSLYFHHMALGGTIGQGIRLSQNNDGFYYSPGFPTSWRRNVHVALVGDPTLRLEYVSPVSELGGNRTEAGLKLSWKASADVEAGAVRYYVYRRSAGSGSFRLLTPEALSVTEYIDGDASEGVIYRVRAAQWRRTSSGTYENGSPAVFWSN